MVMNLPPVLPENPFTPRGDKPRSTNKGPRPDAKKGKWDESSVERDLPFIEEAIRIIDMAQTSVQFDKSNSAKKGIRQDLEQAGWQYNSRATFRANLPFHNKYLVLDSSYQLDHKNSYRIKVSTSHGIVSDYKICKWKGNTYPGFELTDLFNTKKGLLIVIICIILLSLSVPLVCSLVNIGK